jgi:alkanesulfonate monooxygenase SsuD/methylene tetrahydromethanopterin reductase-like flavin-dependent oxidoreductase (luciferase family)
MSFHRPEMVASIVREYRAEAARAGWEPTEDDIVYRGHALVADTDARADELEPDFLPSWRRYLLAGPVPGPAPESSLERSSPNGLFEEGRILFAGSPDTVVQRMRAFHEMTGVGVVDLTVSSAQIPQADVRRTVELFGREVLPRIRDFAAVATAAAG